MITGANIGGNHSTEFEFMGGVGYEATGYLGAIIGAVIGMLLGIVLGLKIAKKRYKKKFL